MNSVCQNQGIKRIDMILQVIIHYISVNGYQNIEIEGYNYCSRCGQALDWSEEE